MVCSINMAHQYALHHGTKLHLRRQSQLLFFQKALLISTALHLHVRPGVLDHRCQRADCIFEDEGAHQMKALVASAPSVGKPPP